MVFLLLIPMGCAAPVPSGPPASARISCDGVPADKCDEAVASVARSLPNTAPVSIEVTCVAGTCTAQSGAMDIVLTLADGSQLRSSTTTWSTAVGQEPGDAKPLPVEEAVPVIPPPVIPKEPVCQGVPLEMCRTMAETAFGELSAASVAQIVVRCGAPPCTDAHGTGDTLVTYADGTTLSSSWEYANQ
jgi:hypothetical protein